MCIRDSYWAVDGDEADINALVDYLEKEIKGEPPVKGNKGNCSNCRYPGCRYNGLQPDQLPDWIDVYKRQTLSRLLRDKLSLCCLMWSLLTRSAFWIRKRVIPS